MKKVELRQATREDVIQFYGALPQQTIRAIVAVLEESPVGICGVIITPERAAIFSDIKDELRPYKKTVFKAAKRVAEMAKQFHMPVVAFGDEPTSYALLTHLGFTSLGEGVYTWDN